MKVIGIGSGVSKHGKDYISLFCTDKPVGNRIQGLVCDKYFVFPESLSSWPADLKLGDEIDIFYNKNGYITHVIKTEA